MTASSTWDFNNVDPVHLRASGSGKWNKYEADVLAAWVADMDFPVAPCVTDTLRSYVESGVHGYPVTGFADTLIEVFCGYVNSRTGIGAVPELVRLCDDAVQGLHAALAACTEPGDGVVILSPIYPPFFASVEQNNRVVVEHRMAPDADGVWRFSFETLRAQIISSGARAMMLCSPHNPVGRLWTRAEAESLASLAVEFDLTIIADEIHSDLVFDGRPFVAFASLGEIVKARTITITSANKAFNLAGLKIAMIVFGSMALSDRFDARVSRRLLGAASTPGVLSNLAVYREGGPWLDAVVEYLSENRHVFAARLAAVAPAVSVVVPEATYLSWLDFSAVPGVLGGGSVGERLVVEARVGFNAGETFGAGLEHCARVNLATSRAILLEIADRIGTWVAAQAA
jgi:cysteine-S-conjugate beta-lyase